MTRFMISAMVGFFLAGCASSVGVGGPGSDSLAKVTIKRASPGEIRAATLAVFRENEFSVLAESPSSITFHKQGGRQAEMTWKTMGNSNPVMIRPTASWVRLANGDYCLMCEVEVAQMSTVEGEIIRRPMLVGKMGYSKLLKEIKRRSEAAVR